MTSNDEDGRVKCEMDIRTNRKDYLSVTFHPSRIKKILYQ